MANVHRVDRTCWNCSTVQPVSHDWKAFVCRACGQQNMVTPTGETTASTFAPNVPAKSSTNFGGIIALAVIAALLVWGFNQCSSDNGGGGGSGPANVKASVSGITPLDAATLEAVLTIRNTGSDTIEPTCTVKALDAGGFTVGFDFFSVGEIPAFGQKRGRITLRIEDEGAFRVADVRASDCD